MSTSRQPKLRFLELCTDVVREILVHCEPPELVSLSRVSRDLRYFILKDPRLWRESMRNLARDIPPRPDHIRDDVLYANLLFGANRCSVCGSLANIVNWEIPSMICKKCIGDSNSTARKRLTPDTRQDERHLSFGTIVPKIKTPTGTLFYNPAIDNLRREYTVFQSEWSSVINFHEWFESMDQAWKHRAREAAVVDRWHNAFKRDQQKAKKAANALVNEARYQAIIHRIEQCSSWKDEMVYVNKRDLLPVIRVRKPQLLTDGDWKKMEPKLKKFFDERQKTSIIVEDKRLGILAETIFAYIPLLAEGPSNIYPPLSNILESQPFKGMIFGTHYSKVIPQVDWEKAVSQNLIRITQDWITKQTTILKNLATSAGRVADLNLAVNLFKCLRCTPGQVLTYGHVLTHECCHGVFWTSRSALPKDDELRHIPSFNLRNIIPITGWDEERVRNIVRICGLDPDRATAEDIHGVDSWLDCQFCRMFSPSWLETGRSYMCWDNAIQHLHAEQWLDPCQQWVRVPDENRRRLWRTSSNSASEIQLPKVICQSCDEVLYHDFAIIDEHSRQHHQKNHSVTSYRSILWY